MIPGRRQDLCGRSWGRRQSLLSLSERVGVLRFLFIEASPGLIINRVSEKNG